MPLTLAKEDSDLLVKCFWVITPFTLAWDLIAHYRTTITTAVSLPLLGNISYSKAVVISFPILSICLWLLSAMVALYARCAERNRSRITGRILPIFGSVNQPLQLLAALLLVVVLMLPVITTTHLLRKMQYMDIVALHDETRYHLTGSQIFDFKEARDWRWCDPQNSAERPTAFPGWQPWLYRLMLLVNYCAFGSAILAMTLPSAGRNGRMPPAEP